MFLVHEDVGRIKTMAMTALMIFGEKKYGKEYGFISLVKQIKPKPVKETYNKMINP